MNPGETDFIPTRESLLSRLKDWQDDASWREFMRVYRRLIYSTALKAGLTAHEADDVVQETIISVARTMEGFDYDRSRCTFKSWLGHLTQKRIADHFRKRSRRKEENFVVHEESQTGTPPLERVADPNSLHLDSIWETEWEKQLFDAAVDRVKAMVSPEQFQLFDFYVLREMPVKKVAEALDSNVAQIYLTKHRVAKLLKKEMKRLENELA